jgi:homoserine dehydrogenase
MSDCCLSIGLFGGGVVGGGVYELIQKLTNSGDGYGTQVKICKICVRSADKVRDFRVDTSRTKVVTDYNDILDDPSINCVVELIGGITDAKDIVLTAIRANKHVVTANKALVATFLDEIQSELTNHPSVQSVLFLVYPFSFCFFLFVSFLNRFAYEAAVCGSIPIIHSLQTDYISNSIHSIRGIMNGTTNYMLCKYEENPKSCSYASILKEAQSLGYAEADPTADVEGYDVVSKIALLAKLSFGKTIHVKTIPVKGITSINPSIDFEYANLLNSTIKLLGSAVKDGDNISVFVSPTIVSKNNPIASINGAGNMVLVDSQNMGLSSYAGAGAGRYPTANSVVNDIIRIAQQKSLKPFPLLVSSSSTVVNNDYSSSFYIRMIFSDGVGIIK